MELFAEQNEGTVAVLMGLAGVVGGAVTWLANFLTGRAAARRAERKEDERTIVDHLNALTARMTTENTDLRSQIARLREQFTVAISHVMYLEGILESKRIGFRPMPREVLANLPGGSGSSEHRVADNEEDDSP